MWRAASYFSATVTFVYVYNTPRERLPSARVVSLLAGFWIVTVAGGWLGVILPQRPAHDARRAAPPGQPRRPRVRPDPRPPDLRPGAGRPRLPARPSDRTVPLHERLGRRVRADDPVLHPRVAAVRPTPSRRTMALLLLAVVARAGVAVAQPRPLGQPPDRAALRRVTIGRRRPAGAAIARRHRARGPRAHRVHAAEGGRRGPGRAPAQQRGPRVPVRGDRQGGDQVTDHRLRRPASLRRPEDHPEPRHPGPVLARPVLPGVRRRLLLRGVPRRR